MIVFESENIEFVHVREDLIDDYLEMVNDFDNVRRYISSDLTKYSYEGEVAWVKKKLDNKDLCYSMIEKSSKKFIGNIELMNVHDKQAELGISITGSMQDKGYGTEAIKSIIRFAFKQLELEMIYLNVFKKNLRAIRCYEKVGFKQAGLGNDEKSLKMVILQKDYSLDETVVK